MRGGIAFAEATLDGRPNSGAARLLGSAAGLRLLRVTRSALTARAPVIAPLAHELRHVVELVEAPWVKDEGGYAALYRAIGTAACSPPTWCFDMRAARDAGRIVWHELRHRACPEKGLAILLSR
jgi:hypothetical protein